MQPKEGLRQQLRRRRRALGAAARAAASRRIAARLLAALTLHPGDTVALYAAVAEEVETLYLAQGLLARGARLAYPRCRPNGPLAFIGVVEPLPLQPSLADLREPSGTPLPLDALATVVVPGLGFDAHGHRLGYGAGHYDRTLGCLAARSVGLAFAACLQPSIPAEPHDRAVDWVVTEDALYVTASADRPR